MTASGNQSADQPVKNLPFARGHVFTTLDGYLAYLQQYNGPLDMPWWREISPGVYRYEIRMADGPEPEIATRAELEEKYGFAGLRQVSPSPSDF